MKKLILSILFGFIGLLFQWGLPFIVGLLLPGDGIQHHGEDEAGRQLKVYFLFGGLLFFTLWAWIGYVSANSWRKGRWMIVGVLIGTIIIVVAPRLVLPSQTGLDDWRYDMAFVFVWAAVSASFAYFLGRRVPTMSA